jgi:hypothetical protein
MDANWAHLNRSGRTFQKMSQNKETRKICLLRKAEVAALLGANVRPGCAQGRHAHISPAEAGDAAQ